MPMNDQIATLAQNSVVPVAKTAPSAAGAALVWFGIPLPDWVMLAGLAYTLLQIFFLLKEHIYPGKKHKRKSSDE